MGGGGVRMRGEEKWMMGGGGVRMRGEEKCTQVLTEEWKELND
jgi:hypothetical protein